MSRALYNPAEIALSDNRSNPYGNLDKHKLCEELVKFAGYNHLSKGAADLIEETIRRLGRAQESRCITNPTVAGALIQDQDVCRVEVDFGTPHCKAKQYAPVMDKIEELVEQVRQGIVMQSNAAPWDKLLVDSQQKPSIIARWIVSYISVDEISRMYLSESKVTFHVSPIDHPNKRLAAIIQWEYTMISRHLATYDPYASSASVSTPNTY